MTKILLVEDDNALREIYGTRLVAEGYDVVSAADGEAALAMAIKEHPDLILSDIMMPKVSGFEMIDILKSTTETKDIKIVVMTALSNDSQRERGESLGVDRYLVKSQVGIEDVVTAIHELLGDADSAPAAPAPVTMPTTATATTSGPVAPITNSAASQPLTIDDQGMVDEHQLNLSGSDKKVIQPLDPNLTLHTDAGHPNPSSAGVFSTTAGSGQATETAFAPTEPPVPVEPAVAEAPVINQPEQPLPPTPPEPAAPVIPDAPEIPPQPLQSPPPMGAEITPPSPEISEQPTV
jgi:CheY-like chemotaxis protein